VRVLADRQALRAPEIILGAPSDTSTDLWSLGCIVRFTFPRILCFNYNNCLNKQLYELLSGERLFDPSFQTEELGLSIEESHLIQIIELFGEFPLNLLGAGEYSSRWFTESGTYISRSHLS
jgi:serine/threonine protein kinase